MTIKSLDGMTMALRSRFLRVLRKPLGEFRHNVYSQNGEDGIVEELFYRLGIRNGWVVEFGAWDGVRFSNTYYLIEREKGFHAVYIEGDRQRYEELAKNARKFQNRVTAICAYIQPSGPMSLQSVLSTTNLPFDFEILSIDVDGIDYHLWENFEGYSPKVVIIEVNSSIPPDEEQIHSLTNQGTSFLSMLKLGKRKGYTCVCHTGNMFFVRNDLVQALKVEESLLSNPELLFCNFWLENRQ